MKKLLYFCSLLMLFVTACTKDDSDPKPTPKTIAGVYKISGLKARADGGQEVNVYNQLNECQKNDTWDFREDGTLLHGGVVTNTCESDDFTGSWSLNNNSFAITTPTNTTTYQLEQFDGRALVISTAGTLNSSPARYFVTFTKN